MLIQIVRRIFSFSFFISSSTPQLDTQLPDRPTVPAQKIAKKKVTTSKFKKKRNPAAHISPCFPHDKIATLIEGRSEKTPRSPMSMCSQLLAVAKGGVYPAKNPCRCKRFLNVASKDTYLTSRWWFQTFFIFTQVGEMIQFD